ncbi:ABC transporter ATP-binding protein [Acidisoma cellulosilytica]|uniref:ABC transporter ATP-binding protein n=1 Tax=Acidisoma cellulosilyticum TaxID=2802395 RepID=A0A963Z6H5_9PROT|nr:ABC transporter ATP-binding protein [Acidisoma cellulosilyticum]MCB8883461.1 ABC transporter ATP-binding protein [Acidisoma cellulosilyticum]
MAARIEVEDLRIDFPLYHGQSRSLKRSILAHATGKRRLQENEKHRLVVEALRAISFTLQPGERLALVGHNGAGKTTLLRALAGVYEPVAGSVRIQGSLNALLDPNQGMNPELTGRENVALRGRYHRMNREAVEALQEDVRSFAELGDFFDLPTRIYSSGMIIRLAFAMATAIRPQVLLMDEWFLAGDAAFREKARERLETMVRGADILVLSTHLNDIVRSWCTRVIWLEDGRVRMDGAVDEVMEVFAGKIDTPALFPEAVAS